MPHTLWCFSFACVRGGRDIHVYGNWKSEQTWWESLSLLLLPYGDVSLREFMPVCRWLLQEGVRMVGGDWQNRSHTNSSVSLLVFAFTTWEHMYMLADRGDCENCWCLTEGEIINCKVSCQGKCSSGGATFCLNQRTASGSVAQIWKPMLGENTRELFLLSLHREAPVPHLQSHPFIIE